MAKRVITTTEFTDDFDGTKAEGSVAFSVDGQQYEIDLSKKNRAAFEKALKPYIEAGRKTRGSQRGTRSGITKRPQTRRDLGAIRDWARANGHDVSDRGRISREIQDAYDSAN